MNSLFLVVIFCASPALAAPMEGWNQNFDSPRAFVPYQELPQHDEYGVPHEEYGVPPPAAISVTTDQ